MKFVQHSSARVYEAKSEKTSASAQEFIDSLNDWGAKYRAALKEVKEFVSTHSSARALGMLSSDALNMSCFGLLFDGNPGAGFIRVPAEVADRIKKQGLRGEGYFPDITHPVGKQAMQLLVAVSRVSESRPLMTNVEGVNAVAVEDGRLVLSRAFRDGGKVYVAAAPSALKPEHDLEPVSSAGATLDSVATSESARSASRSSKPSPRM